jgi:hypothetical protein
VKIRLLETITGSFHNIDAGVVRGQVVDVEDVHALRYINAGLAERVGKEPAEESAVIEPGKVESAVVKKRTGRPKKQPDWHEEHAPGWKDASPES